MKRVLFLAGLILALSSCGGSDTDSKSSEDKKEKAGDKKTGNKVKQETLDLIQHDNTNMGFSMKIPKEFEILLDSPANFTANMRLPTTGAMIEVTVNIYHEEFNTIDDFKEYLRMLVADKMTTAEKRGNGFYVINDFGYSISHHYAEKGRLLSILAPPAYQDMAEQMLHSFKIVQ